MTYGESLSPMRQGRVTISKTGGGYDISINGSVVEFAKTKAEAKKKADRIRKMQGKLSIRKASRKKNKNGFYL